MQGQSRCQAREGNISSRKQRAERKTLRHDEERGNCMGNMRRNEIYENVNAESMGWCWVGGGKEKKGVGEGNRKFAQIHSFSRKRGKNEDQSERGKMTQNPQYRTGGLEKRLNLGGKAKSCSSGKNREGIWVRDFSSLRQSGFQKITKEKKGGVK